MEGEKRTLFPRIGNDEDDGYSTLGNSRDWAKRVPLLPSLGRDQRKQELYRYTGKIQWEWIKRRGIEQCHSNIVELNGQIKVPKMYAWPSDTHKEMGLISPSCSSSLSYFFPQKVQQSMMPQKEHRTLHATKCTECSVETDPFKSELQVNQRKKESVATNSNGSWLDGSLLTMQMVCCVCRSWGW